MTQEDSDKLIDQIASQLAEHFDAVQILVSWNECGISMANYRGAGNWYARQGMAHHFINADIAQEAAHQLSGTLNQQTQSPDGDDWKD